MRSPSRCPSSESLSTHSENGADTIPPPQPPWSLGAVTVPGERLSPLYNPASSRSHRSCSPRCLTPPSARRDRRSTGGFFAAPAQPQPSPETAFLCVSSYNVSETAGSVSVTVQRSGNLNQYAIVLCRTEQGTASPSSRGGSQRGQQDYVEYAGQVGGQGGPDCWSPAGTSHRRPVLLASVAASLIFIAPPFPRAPFLKRLSCLPFPQGVGLARPSTPRGSFNCRGWVV